MSFWGDVVGDVEAIIQGVSGGGIPLNSGVIGTAESAEGAVSTASGFITLVEGIWADLTDWRLWASLGWLILGLFLIMFGIALWFGREALKEIGPIASVLPLLWPYQTPCPFPAGT